MLPLDRTEWLRESKPGSVLLSDDILLFLYIVRVCIAERPVPHSIFVCHAEIESPADDWVRTVVCKRLSRLCSYDWLSIYLFSWFVFWEIYLLEPYQLLISTVAGKMNWLFCSRTFSFVRVGQRVATCREVLANLLDISCSSEWKKSKIWPSQCG